MDELVKGYVAYCVQQETQLKESRKSYDFSKLITALLLRHPQGLQLDGDRLIISLVLRELVSKQEELSVIEKRFSSLSKFELDSLFKESYQVFSGLLYVKDPFPENSSLTYQSTAPGYVLGQLPWEKAIEVLTACVKINGHEQGNYEVELPVLLTLVEAVKRGEDVYTALLFELAQAGALSFDEREAEKRLQTQAVQEHLLNDTATLLNISEDEDRGRRTGAVRNYALKLQAIAPRLEYYDLRRAVDQFIDTLKANR